MQCVWASVAGRSARRDDRPFGGGGEGGEGNCLWSRERKTPVDQARRVKEGCREGEESRRIRAREKERQKTREG